ncbi:hypothetical protein FXB41_13010 [Bradyrhizobium canariense]|uniref:hypothetical protein n=1 Tax=Bradyrhizobium canariense TaxID=255045 RepID=UPI001CA5CC6F|nr:hypothetical protein [Bradyrhizobium canariense]MBW5435670.1 hypothetical protein [Bradyrhizobium canariense]
MAQILRLLGFWPPLVYAVAVFGLFWLLDRNAAPRARKAVSSWFAGAKYEEQHVGDAVLYFFDRLYTAPLLGWRAFLTSAAISTVATILVSSQVFPPTLWLLYYRPEVFGWSAFTQLLTNISADYLSLFVIRRWIIFGKHRPLLALLTAPLIGVIIIVICYWVRDVGGFSIKTRTFEWRYFLDDLVEWWGFISNKSFRWALLVPAFLVHLWLPLFAFGVIVAKAVNYVRTAGKFSQWFFAQGDAHPLRSIGYVAAAATFLITAVVMVLLRG